MADRTTIGKGVLDGSRLVEVLKKQTIVTAQANTARYFIRYDGETFWVEGDRMANVNIQEDE